MPTNNDLTSLRDLPAGPAAKPETRRLPSPDRHMSVTPLDLRQAKFSSAMRGFDRAEVTALLLEAADGYEQALRENERLRHELARLEAALHHHRQLEGSLKTTLMSAQKVADDMRENAQQEAARIVREAEGRVEVLLARAQARLEDIERAIDGLRLKRREAESGLETIIAALHRALDFVREQDQRESRVVPFAAGAPLAADRPHAEVASPRA
ncbi:MAG TPA: DivIVA domain-containing protein [Vicinamibacterales bacterium]|nr:DivIVA domain-containing protein [Vicinamibacterales bacterium]